MNCSLWYVFRQQRNTSLSFLFDLGQVYRSMNGFRQISICYSLSVGDSVSARCVTCHRNFAVDSPEEISGRYRPQSAMSCSTLRERATWSSPYASQVSLVKISLEGTMYVLLNILGVYSKVYCLYRSLARHLYVFGSTALCFVRCWSDSRCSSSASLAWNNPEEKLSW